MLRRTAIKSIVSAALGVVGLRKKPELFVVDISDARTHRSGYYTTKDGKKKPVNPPLGHWNLHQIVFKKVDGCTK